MRLQRKEGRSRGITVHSFPKSGEAYRLGVQDTKLLPKEDNGSGHLFADMKPPTLLNVLFAL